MQDALEKKLSLLIETEVLKVHEHIGKSNLEIKSRVGSCESYTQDKIDLVKHEMRVVEQHLSRMATTQMMDKIVEDNKSLKMKFQLEFDQFQ